VCPSGVGAGIQITSKKGDNMKYRLLRRALLLTCIVGLCGLGSVRFQTHAQTQDDVSVAKRFVGMWRLVSHPNRLTDGTTQQHVRSVAYIIYTDTNPNHMCYVAMDPNRPKWKSELAPTESEAMSEITGSRSYCSTVEIHAKEGFVIHHVEIANVPNLVGRDLKRWFTFDGPNRLTLRVDPTGLQPGIAENTLIWERVQ
jgi:Lipocalin-like domain